MCQPLRPASGSLVRTRGAAMMSSVPDRALAMRVRRASVASRPASRHAPPPRPRKQPLSGPPPDRGRRRGFGLLGDGGSGGLRHGCGNEVARGCCRCIGHQRGLCRGGHLAHRVTAGAGARQPGIGGLQRR
jgi:hypothetical protein